MASSYPMIMPNSITIISPSSFSLRPSHSLFFNTFVFLRGPRPELLQVFCSAMDQPIEGWSIFDEGKLYNKNRP